MPRNTNQNDTMQFPPQRCSECGQARVELKTVEYDAEIRHDGKLYAFTIPNLTLPVCVNCGEKLFTEQVDDQVNNALRLHLRLLTPAQIRAGIGRLEINQKELAERIGIAEATLSRWMSGVQIQSKAMDRLLRIFFAYPQVREGLASNDPELFEHCEVHDASCHHGQLFAIACDYGDADRSLCQFELALAAYGESYIHAEASRIRNGAMIPAY